MLIGATQKPFDSPEHTFELKLDGTRAVAYIDGAANKISIINKREKELMGVYPELSALMSVGKKCILDGEITIINERGEPDFKQLMNRALLTDPTRIRLAARKTPAHFTAFDCVYLTGTDLSDLTLLQRRQALRTVIAAETPFLSYSRDFAEGKKLFEAVKKRGLEGVVAKLKTSKYFFGKRTADWVKIKALLDEDFIVCGYYFGEKEAAVVSVIIGSFNKEGKIVQRGHLALGKRSGDFLCIKAAKKVEKRDFYADFEDAPNAVWLAPQLVCTAEFVARTASLALRQPVFKGLRADADVSDCVLPDKN